MRLIRMRLCIFGRAIMKFIPIFKIQQKITPSVHFRTVRDYYDTDLASVFFGWFFYFTIPKITIHTQHKRIILKFAS